MSQPKTKQPWMLTEEEAKAIFEAHPMDDFETALTLAQARKLVEWQNEDCTIPNHDSDNWAETYPRYECSGCVKQLRQALGME